MQALLKLLLITSLVPASADNDCTDINGSKDGEGWRHIDKLAGSSVKINDPKFNSTYEIGVCKNLLEANETEYAGAVETTMDGQKIIVGRYNESVLMAGSHWILLKYMNGDPYEGRCGGSNRHAAIMFVCNHDADTLNKTRIMDENLDRDKNCYHLFEVENCVACISDGCNAFFYSLTPGSVILIVLFSATGVYLLSGWLYTRFIKKRRGWRQIPNAEFWQEIGHLQADGCNLVCRCGKRPTDDYQIVGGMQGTTPPSLMSSDEALQPA
ncbi:cation-dependent mannose-6-phosphate receptor-like [Watersipora subatra]|uniref:cation-dependent mannose-6-phosphate receptor-like n=1 Tax=Watersipora subatra TaxID=2589382 RepID=UPI00355BD066